MKHPAHDPMNAVRSTQDSSGLPLVYRGIAALGALSFLFAAVTGIWRIAVTRGFAIAAIPEWLPPHGHLMVGGFLAAVIMFERIIALRINLLAWVPYVYVVTGVLLYTGSSTVRVVHLIALTGWIVHRWMAYRAFGKYEKPVVESVAYITLSSALNYPGGLAAGPIVSVAALSFPIATIVVERLEMSLNFRKTGARIVLWLLMAWCALWSLSAWFDLLSLPSMGVITLLVAAGSVRYDMSVRMKASAGPLQQFLRRALKIGYAWFFLSGLAMMFWNYLPGAVAKDVLFHLLGLGFIFTMILAHAPLILPAAIGKLPPPSAPIIPFIAFQLFTAGRIVADLFVVKSVALWGWSGWITGILHLVSFLIYMVLVIRSLNRPSLGNHSLANATRGKL